MSLRKSQLKQGLGDSRKTPEAINPLRKLSGQGFKIFGGRDNSPSPVPSTGLLSKDGRKASPFENQRKAIGRGDYFQQKREAVLRSDLNTRQTESKSFGGSLGGPLEQRKKSLKYVIH